MWLISNKVSIKDSGLLEGFCDCHCHLLPGVDDGVQEMQETMQILELWEQTGVREVWLTPHIMEDVPNSPEDLSRRFEELKTSYHGSVGLHLAAENMMDRLFHERLEQKNLLPIGKAGTHLLVETSYYNPPMNLQETIDSIRETGFTPILAHPERYQYMDMDDYQKWKQHGVLLQLNIASLVGAYGPEVQKKAEWLLGKEMYDCCGTDTHSLDFVEDFLDGSIKKKTVAAVRRIMGKMIIDN
jgi:tyrosine-protein phosphatase YwqE